MTTHEDYDRQADALEAVMKPITQQLRSALRAISEQFREAIEKTTDPAVEQKLRGVFMGAGHHFSDGLQELDDIACGLRDHADVLRNKASSSTKRAK